MTQYYFTGPTTSEGPAGGGRLFIRYRLDRGITLLRQNNVWTEIRFPTEDQTGAADYVLWGGYKNVINQEIANELTAAGYGQYIIPIDQWPYSS